MNVYIIGETFFGVRHGLETFTQLVAFNREVGSLQVSNEFVSSRTFDEL